MMLLQSCGSIEIKDTKHCAVAGVVSAGADCVTLVSGTTSSLTFDDLIDMLEPNEQRGGAIITPVDDFVELKKSLEKACVLLDNRCTKEIKKKIETANKNLKQIIKK